MPRPCPEDKLLGPWDWEKAHQFLRVERPTIRRLVITNGCFDLLGAHHVRMLERARGCGEKLLVAVNADCSVGRLKGVGRPVVIGRDRYYMLAALACVDYVVTFREDTPVELLQRFKPEVLCKGEGTHMPYPGAEHAGIVVTIPRQAGLSTSERIEQIQYGAGSLRQATSRSL